MIGPSFFQKKANRYLPISFDPTMSQANSPQQIKIVERLGVSVAVGASIDGSFSFSEYTVGVVGEAGKLRKTDDIRCLLPQRGLTEFSDDDARRYHAKEFKIVPGCAYNYVVLDRYFVDSLPKYKIGKDLKKILFDQSIVMQSNPLCQGK